MSGSQFAGHAGRGMMASLLTFPAAYMANAINQKSLMTKGVPAFPMGYVDPPKAAIGAGLAIGAGPLILKSITKSLQKVHK